MVVIRHEEMAASWERVLFVIVAIFPCFLHVNKHSASCSESDEMIPRIGIIGAGLGGTASAYFLRQMFGKAKIDIFEPNRVGGRTATIRIDGQEYEAGGSIIHAKNRYMVDLTKQLLGDKARKESSIGVLGLYSTDGLIFETSKWTAVTLAKLLWRYGWDLYNVQHWTKGLLAQFERIYDFQNAGLAFTTLEDLLKAMGDDMFNLTRYSMNDVLRDVGISHKFIDELAMAAMRNNYGQTPSVHGLVGAIALFAMEPGLWSVINGNKQVAISLLEASEASLVKGKVTSVALIKGEHGSGSVSYEVEYEQAGGKTGAREYDIVILAVPLQGTKHPISFVDFPNPITPFDQDFHTTVAMFVQGTINKTTFNFDSFPPDLLTVSPELYFNSIGEQSPVSPGTETSGSEQETASTAVWKTFLNKVPSQEQVNHLFNLSDDMRLVEWQAYPEYKPNMDLPPFVLYDKLYYVNAIESAASAMEMSVIGAKNVALLAHHHWNNNLDKIDELTLPGSQQNTNERTDL